MELIDLDGSPIALRIGHIRTIKKVMDKVTKQYYFLVELDGNILIELLLNESSEKLFKAINEQINKDIENLVMQDMKKQFVGLNEKLANILQKA